MVSTIDGGHYAGFIEMSGKAKRRYWSNAEKQQIVDQSRVPGVSVSQVARRYNVNANLVFRWLRDPRFNAGPAAPEFLPVAVAEGTDLIIQDSMVPAEPETSSPQPDVRIVISVAGGHRLEISGVFDGNAVAMLLKGLAS
jgi:transposase